MLARRTLAAAVVIIAASTGAACSGSSPTLADAASELEQPGVTMPGGGAPTDTTGFLPAP